MIFITIILRPIINIYREMQEIFEGDLSLTNES